MSHPIAPKKFYLFVFLQLIAMVPIRSYFLGSNVFSDPSVQAWVFWLATGVLSTALVRRIGVMNLLESFFVTAIWFFFGLLSDLLVTSSYTGMEVFSKYEYWTSYVIIAGCVFIFHKKFHIHRRHTMHAAKHAAAHGHGAGHEKKH